MGAGIGGRLGGCRSICSGRFNRIGGFGMEFCLCLWSWADGRVWGFIMDVYVMKDWRST